MLLNGILERGRPAWPCSRAAASFKYIRCVGQPKPAENRAKPASSVDWATPYVRGATFVSRSRATRGRHARGLTWCFVIRSRCPWCCAIASFTIGLSRKIACGNCRCFCLRISRLRETEAKRFGVGGVAWVSMHRFDYCRGYFCERPVHCMTGLLCAVAVLKPYLIGFKVAPLLSFSYENYTLHRYASSVVWRSIHCQGRVLSAGQFTERLLTVSRRYLTRRLQGTC